MKKIRKIVCISTMVAMLMSTMGIGAFAVTDNVSVNDGDNGITVESVEGVDAEVNGEGEIVESEPVETEEEIVDEATIILSAICADKKVMLKWNSISEKTYSVFEKDDLGWKTLFTGIADNPDGNVQEISCAANGEEHVYKVQTEEVEDPIVSNEICAIPNILKISAFAGYLSVHLKWNHLDGAKSYTVTRTSDGKVFTVAANPNEEGYIEYRDTSDKAKNGGNGLNWDTTYKYMVTANYVDEGSVASSTIDSNVVSMKCVKPMYYKITFNKNRTLKSHEGKKKSYTFKKGFKTYAYSFGGGCYKFYYTIGGKVYEYHVNKTSTYKTGKNKRACSYSATANYSVAEAEYFVNDLQNMYPAEKNKWLIFTSTNCQHVYVCKAVSSNGKYVWKVKDGNKHWECATGKASAPSPWFSTKHRIYKKLKSRHSIPYWNCFLSWNAFHGKLKNWSVGKPASGGCVRNVNSNAKYIRDNVPIGTKVLIY